MHIQYMDAYVQAQTHKRKRKSDIVWIIIALVQECVISERLRELNTPCVFTL